MFVFAPSLCCFEALPLDVACSLKCSLNCNLEIQVTLSDGDMDQQNLICKKNIGPKKLGVESKDNKPKSAGKRAVASFVQQDPTKIIKNMHQKVTSAETPNTKRKHMFLFVFAFFSLLPLKPKRMQTTNGFMLFEHVRIVLLEFARANCYNDDKFEGKWAFRGKSLFNQTPNASFKVAVQFHGQEEKK